jgi:hypothetical protein
MGSSLSPLRMTANLKVQFLYSRPLMCGKLTLNLRASFFFAWLALHNKALTAHNMATKSWPCNPLCSLWYCEPESLHHHLLAGCNYVEALWNATAAHFNLPDYAFLAPIKVCCSGSQSSIRQVAEKKGRLNSAFSFPFDSNCGKKKIGECFRLKRNPSYRLLLSFRMRLLFYLLCDAGSSQAMLSSLDHLKSWSQAELLLSQGAVFVGLWAFLFPVFRMLSVSLKKALLVRCFLF